MRNSVQSSGATSVFVVSLGNDVPDGWHISWIDIVKKRSLYFHPVGINGWPKVPPTYIAFRYYGELQSIHHIEDYEVLTNLQKSIPELPLEEWEPHFLYKLGPAFRPDHPVPTGTIWANGRKWCMLDTLFTAKTIWEAAKITQQRDELAEGKGSY
jgi:hypothetical protein